MSSAAPIEYPADALGDEDAAVVRRGEVDMARVVADLHKDPHVGKLLEQRAGKARPLRGWQSPYRNRVALQDRRTAP